MSTTDVIYNPEWKSFIRTVQTNKPVISFRRDIFDMTGNIYTALILSELIYWYLPSKEPNPKYPTKLRIRYRGYYWFIRSRQDWADAVYMKIQQYDYNVRKLKKLGYVKTRVSKFKGVRKVFIRLTNTFVEEYNKVKCLNEQVILTKDMTLNQKIRNLQEYKRWRRAVMKRDNYTCKVSGETGCIEVHHIKPLAKLLIENKITSVDEAKICQELWNISNGISLLYDLHSAESTNPISFHTVYGLRASEEDFKKWFLEVSLSKGGV